jgi:hypothetical protein
MTRWNRDIIKKLTDRIAIEHTRRHFVHVVLNHPTPDEMVWLPRRARNKYIERMRALYKQAPLQPEILARYTEQMDQRGDTEFEKVAQPGAPQGIHL